jgi:carbon monoxide dehydrogenase subunit G
MRVFGAGTVGAPVDAVWAALADPDVLRRAIPRCERLDVTGPGRCELTVATAIAAVAGTYSGQAEIRERHGPGLLLAAKVSAAGGRGSVGADVTVRLSPASDGATELGYEIEAQVDGAIAGVGQLVLASVARRLAAEFIGGLAAAAGDRQAAGEPLVAVTVPTPGEPQLAGTAPTPGDRPRVRDALQAEDTLQAADDRPAGSRPGWSRIGAQPGVRAGLAAGAAAGVAGILIGAVLGRRGRSRPRGSR